MGKANPESWYHAQPGELGVAYMNKVLALIRAEIERSTEIHGCPMWGRHEAFAIIKEELDEAWDCIKGDEQMHFLVVELIQVAAMCVRYLATDKAAQYTILYCAENEKLVELAMRAEFGVGLKGPDNAAT